MEDYGLSKDMVDLAKTVARMILADRAHEIYLESGEECRGKFCEAYMHAWGKKVEAMQTTYVTNVEARVALRESIGQMIKEGE